MIGTAPKILVLEDMAERVDWLTDTLAGTGIRVVWCPSVSVFRRELAICPGPAMIILDHDLGSSREGGDPLKFSFDAHGECGLDGAKAIPAESKTPVLVWSVNRSGSKSMMLDLRSRGIACRWLPFLAENKWALGKIVLTMCEPSMSAEESSVGGNRNT